MFWALLAGSLPSCGGSGETCLRTVIAYAGAKSGAAYLRITGDNGLSYASNSPSIQLLIEIESSFVTCSKGGQTVDIPLSAVAWIDISGAGSTTCSDLRNAQCRPSPTDPQGHQSAVMRFGQYNEIHIEVLDQP